MDGIWQAGIDGRGVDASRRVRARGCGLMPKDVEAVVTHVRAERMSDDELANIASPNIAVHIMSPPTPIMLFGMRNQGSLWSA